MSTCRKCGQEITFRHKNGHCVTLHLSGACNEHGDSPCDGEMTCYTRCPRCSRMVYFVRHNGGSVWFDELGLPWPKHPCFDADPGCTQAAIQAAMRSPLFEQVNRASVGNANFPLIRRDLLRHVPLDEQGRRQCQFCDAKVRPEEYADHLTEKDGMGVIADVIRRHCRFGRVRTN